MAVLASQMFDQLRDLLGDPNDNEVSFATKRLYLNLGIARMWPRVWVTGETSVALTNGIYEYAMAKATYREPVIISVEYSYDADADNYRRITSYDVIPGDEESDGYLRLKFNPADAGVLRIRHAVPVPQIAATTYAAAQAETWAAPDALVGLPVLYAMGLIAVRRMENRLDLTRVPPSNEQRSGDETGLIQSAHFWMDEFNRQVAEYRPLPVAED